MADNEIKLEEQVLDGEQVGLISADITLDKMVGSIAMQDQFLSGAGEEIVIEVREDIEVTGVSDLLELKADFDNITDNIKSSIIEAQNTVSDANATLKNIIAYLDDIEDMKDQVAEDRSQVSKMKSDVEDMQTRVTDLSSSVFQAKNYVDNEVANFDTKLEEANKLDSSIKDQVSEANRVLRSISNRSTEFDTKLSTAKGYLDSVTNLKGSVENLAKQVSSDKEDVSNNQSIVDRLTKEVRTTKAAIDSIESSLNTKHSEVLIKADEVEADRAQVASRATQVSSDASEVSTWHSETKTFRDDAQESKAKAFQWRSDAETFRDLAETASDNAADSETKAENYKDAAEKAQADVSTKHSDVVTKHADVVNKANQVASNTAKVASNKAATDNNAAAAQQSEDEAENWADEAKAWAISKPNNSAKYWAEEAEKALNKAYVSGGTWNPKKQGEYPSTANISGDTRWTVVLGGRNETYRYTSGDLDDITVRSGDELFYDISESKWSVIQVPLTSGVESVITPLSGEEQGRVTITAAKLNSLTKTESDNRYLAKRAKAESAKVADAANKLSTPITVSITGDATGQVSDLDGSKDVSIPVTIDSYKKPEADGKFANKTEVVPKSGGEFTGNVNSTSIVTAPRLRTAADGSWGLYIGTNPSFPWIAPIAPDNDLKPNYSKQLRYVPSSGRWQANDRDIFTKEFPPNANDVNARSNTWVPSWDQVANKPTIFPTNWDSIKGKSIYSTRWANWNEIGSKPSTFPSTWDQVSGKPDSFITEWGDIPNKPEVATRWPKFSEVTNPPATATRWPSFGEVTGKPSVYPTNWANVGGKPKEATRWPTPHEVGAVPVETSGGHKVAKISAALNKDSSLELTEKGGEHGLIVGYNGDDNYGYIAGRHSGRDVKIATFNRDGKFVDVKTNLRENGQRVYSPNNKPTASDVGARPSNWTPRWQDIRLKPATFDSEWSKISGKPASYPSSWNDVANKPRFATRWPTINEVLSRNDVSNSKLSFRMKGCAIDIGGAQVNDADTYIRMGNPNYAWKVNYKGSSSGEAGNELQVISTRTGKGYQIDHQGNFELEKGNGWEQVATVNSDITGNAKTATTATTASNANKLNGRADYYHPANKPSAADVGLGNLSQAQHNELKITTDYGYVLVGGANNDWCHFFTDLPKFYFGKGVAANGDVTLYSNQGTRLDSSSGNIYEHGKRVYSPNNKPTAADVGAEPALSPEQTRSIFTGTGSPSNALGEDGDLYIED